MTMNNPPKNNAPDKALVERLRATKANCNFGSTLCARDAHAAADEIDRLATLSQPQHGGLVEAATDALAEIVALREWIDQHVPGKLIASEDWGKLHRPLVTRTVTNNLRAALANSPVVGEDGPPETIDGVETGNTVAPNTPTTAGRREAIANAITSNIRLEWRGHDHASINPRSVSAAVDAILSLIAGTPEVKRKPIAEGATDNGAALMPDAERKAAVDRYAARPTGDA